MKESVVDKFAAGDMRHVFHVYGPDPALLRGSFNEPKPDGWIPLNCTFRGGFLHLRPLEMFNLHAIWTSASHVISTNSQQASQLTRRSRLRLNNKFYEVLHVEDDASYRVKYRIIVKELARLGYGNTASCPD